jgi:hypothetical protein
VSRRKRPAAGRAPASGSAAGPPAAAAPSEPRPGARGAEWRPSRRAAADVAILVAVFAVTAGVAELAGAANLGVAIAVGQVAFAIALVVLLLRG